MPLSILLKRERRSNMAVRPKKTTGTKSIRAIGTVKLYINPPLFLEKGHRRMALLYAFDQATSHLCFFTEYRGMKGSRMGTVVTYF